MSSPATSRPWAAFWPLAIGATLTLMDQSLVSISLASIQQFFGVDGVVIQLLVIGHAIAYALALLPAGRLGDLIGHRSVLLIALGVLLAAAALGALAPSIGVLVAARVLQGVGAGLLTPQILGLIQRLFPGEQRMRPMGILSAVMAAPMALAPSLGGVILQLAGGAEAWRAVFFVTLAAETVVVVLVLLLLPRALPTDRAGGFDVPSLLLLAPAIIGLVVPLSLVAELTQLWWAMAGLLVLGVAFGIPFVRRQRRLAAGSGRVPLLDLGLFRIGTFGSGVVIAGLAYATSSGSGLVLNLYLQQGVGLAPALVALCLLPNAIAVGLTSWWVSRSRPTRLARLVTIGTAISAGTFLALVAAAVAGPAAAFPVAVLCATALLGFSNGFYTAPNQTVTLADVPDDRSGSAAAVMQLCQRLGTTLGTSTALSAYYAFDAGGGSQAGAVAALGLAALLIAVAHLLSRLRPRGPRDPRLAV